MKKNSKYMTRALDSRDPRFKHILNKLGYDRRDMKAEEPAKVGDPTVDQEFEQAIPEGSLQEQIEHQQGHPQEQEENLTTLRAKYKEVLGKQPYHAWDEDELRKRISEAS